MRLRNEEWRKENWRKEGDEEEEYQTNNEQAQGRRKWMKESERDRN